MHRFEPRPPLVIGVVGGIAAGKSTVARLLCEAGLVHVDADALAREVTSRPAVLAALVTRFGQGILGSDGALDRAALARLAFAEPDARAALEAITHPPIRAEIQTAIDAAIHAGRSVVLDAPLLLEGPLGDRCDAIVFVDASEATRLERARGRGWDEAEWRRREAAQLPTALKRARTSATIPNDGDLAETRRRIAALLAHWRIDDPRSP